MSLGVLNYSCEFTYFYELQIKVAKKSFFDVKFCLANPKWKAFLLKRPLSKMCFVYIFGKVYSLSFKWGPKHHDMFLLGM